MSQSEKISLAEFNEMLADPDIPDERISEYLVGRPAVSKPFLPGIAIDTLKVEVGAADEFVIRGAFAMNWANGVARRRREKSFEKRRAAGERQPVIVSEGDSWSQFPFLLRDIVDHLDPDYLVYDVAAGGDTLQNMIYNAPEYEKALAKVRPDVKAFIFSGAGNDYMGAEPDGTPVLAKVLRRHSPGKPAAWYLETPEFDLKLAFVRDAYRKLLMRLQEVQPRLPVVLRPVYAQWDGWLAAPLRSINVDDPALQMAIVREMVDRLNETQKKVCAAFPMARHVDLRETLPEIGDWADELHPTSVGFRKAAAKIRTQLQQLI
jgi:hypothetical protein